MGKATKDLKGLERQAGSTQSALKRLASSFKQTLPQLGVSGTLAGLLGGFSFTRFAKDSLGKFSETPQGSDFKKTLDDFNASVTKIKVNFGEWLATTAGLNNALKGLSAILPRLAGSDITSVQTEINQASLAPAGFDQTREALEKAKAAREKLLQEMNDPREARFEKMRSSGLQFGRAFEPDSEVRQQQLLNLNREVGFHARRLSELRNAGAGRGIDIEPLFQKGLMAAVPLFEQLGQVGVKALGGIGDAMLELDSMLGRAESDLTDFMAAFKIQQGQRTPFDLFQEEISELRRLFMRGFLPEASLKRGLFDAAQRLDNFIGRPTAAAFGTQEAFASITSRTSPAASQVPKLLAEILSDQKKATEQASETHSTLEQIERRINTFLGRTDPKKPDL